MKTSEVLYKAIDILHERGWTQDVYENAEGNVCSLGAIDSARMDLDLSTSESGADDPIEALEEIIGYQDVPEWNDAPERTFEDVLLAFKTAAYEAELREAE